jgi:hypothetical protein
MKRVKNKKILYMCFIWPDKRIVHSIALSNTPSKLKHSISLIKIIIKNIILKIFIFEYITKSCYLIVYGLENIFLEKNLK